MTEPQNTPGRSPEGERPPEEAREPYVPASPAKRVLAWMGVVYMVIIVILTTYNLSTGAPLQGAPGVMLFPAFGALSALALLRFRAERRAFPLLLGILAAAACAVSLALGILALAGR